MLRVGGGEYDGNVFCVEFSKEIEPFFASTQFHIEQQDVWFVFANGLQGLFHSSHVTHVGYADGVKSAFQATAGRWLIIEDQDFHDFLLITRLILTKASIKPSGVLENATPLPGGHMSSILARTLARPIFSFHLAGSHSGGAVFLM